MDWKRYPHVPAWGDPREFTLPAADGFRSEVGVATYFVDGFLRGHASGRQWAFMTIFTDMWVLGHRVRASFFTFALFDCDTGRYGTYTDEDFPRPPRVRRRYKIAVEPGHLALRYQADAGACRWENLRAPDGSLAPFAWILELHGIDQHGVRMALALTIDAKRPPAPLGGPLLGGEMMFLGAPRTYSYFQSGLTMSGRLAWGNVSEEVSGTIGWIDRQWARDDFSRYQDRQSARYRHEWRVMQFDNGWDMSCFQQYLRPQRNAVVPWSGLSAQGPGPAHEIRATTAVEVTIPEFVRSPGLVRGRYMLTEGPRWFPRRYRMRVPGWDMDVAAEPLVETPAHRLPIEYWTGPVRLRGTVFGTPVTGLGFDERARPWISGAELARALALSATHRDDVPPDYAQQLAYRAHEVEALALRDDHAAARTHLATHVTPLFEGLPAPARTHLTPLLEDTRTVLTEGRRLP